LRTRWLLIVGIVLGMCLLVACVLWFPRLILTADVGRHNLATMDHEMAAKAINNVRTTLLQGLGGGVLLLGAFFTWQQLRATREGQLTDRYTKAVDQLDEAKALPVRVGGLYALERIARESRVDQGRIATMLCAYARTAKRKEPPTPERGLAERAADVQAALTILARWRTYLDVEPRWLDLHGAEFQGARLHNAQLQGAQLFGAQLQDAHHCLESRIWQGRLVSQADLYPGVPSRCLLRARCCSCRSCTPGSQSLPYVADGPTRGSPGTPASRRACTYARSCSIRART
jgi:hypothetical protein